MKGPLILSAALVGAALFHGGASASDAAIARLAECMKMRAASPEQGACLKAVESLRQPAAKAKSAGVAMPAKAKSMAASGQAPQKVIEPPPEVKSAAATLHVNGAPVGGVGGIGQVTVRDLKGLDLETAMMLVQSQRAELLEGQLKGQLEAISQRNKDIAALNALLGDLKKLRPGGTDPEKWGNLGASAAAGKTTYARLKAAGVTFPAGSDEVNEPGTGIYDAKQKTFDAWAEQIKGKIDASNSSQQMDMLRMQSLTNKRNEAFDLMTNFIKKMADSRSSVLGNMR